MKRNILVKDCIQ